MPRLLLPQVSQKWTVLACLQVPRSSKLVFEDNEYGLYSVVLFKRVADTFKTAARSAGYQVGAPLFETAYPGLPLKSGWLHSCRRARMATWRPFLQSAGQSALASELLAVADGWQSRNYRAE